MTELTPIIKSNMVRTGIDMQKLSKRLGVSLRTTYEYVNHPENMKVSTLVRIFDITKAPEDDRHV